MNNAAKKAAIMLLAFSSRKRQRLLQKLPPEVASQIQQALEKAEQLSLSTEDFLQQKLPLAAFDCASKAELQLLRMHQSMADQTNITEHAKKAFLELVIDERRSA